MYGIMVCTYACVQTHENVYHQHVQLLTRDFYLHKAFKKNHSVIQWERKSNQPCCHGDVQKLPLG
jgi:hypothetical protein